MISLLYISALLLGIGGSLHCIGMCGPLAMSLPFSGVATSNKNISILIYLFSKAFGYGIIGLLFGLIGKSFLILNWQQNLSIIAGIILLLITVIPYLKEHSTRNFIFKNQFNIIYKRIIEKPQLKHFFLFGIINAFLPCGLVYAALAGATVSHSAIGGFTFMFLFGVGTSPALISIILFSNKINLSFRKHIKSSSYYISLLIAIILIIRGMNLGIPYVSPEVKINSEKHLETIKCKACNK